MHTYDRLTMAIARIQTDGHTQCTTWAPDGVCLLASLLTEEELGRDYGLLQAETMDLLRDAVHAMGFRSRWWMSEAERWNDEPGRRVSEVLARLEAGRDFVLHRELDAAAVAAIDTLNALDAIEASSRPAGGSTVQTPTSMQTPA